MINKSTGDNQGSETTQYGIIIVDTCHYSLMKIHGMHTTKSEPWHELWTLGDDGGSVQVHQP